MGWFGQLFSRRRRYNELSESIRDHLDEKVADLMDRGMTREQAEHAAHREFGNVALIEERSREVWQRPTLESILSDARFAIRQLWKAPGFTVTAIREAAPLAVYLPFGTDTRRLQGMTVIIHSHTLAEGESAYRKALHEFTPSSPETEPIAFAVQFDDAISSVRLLSTLSGFFAGLVLLLSGIGVYGLMASYVNQRTIEIGVRMAFGATRMAVFNLIMKQASILLAVGIVAGSCLGIIATHSIKAFLYEVSPTSLTFFAAAVVIMALCGFMAALHPARRAISIDPMQALRTE